MICGGQILAYYLFKDNFIYPILDDFWKGVLELAFISMWILLFH